MSAPARADADVYPWAMDLDAVWHRRRPGTGWTISDTETNAEVVCPAGAIPSAHVANSPLEPQTGETMCPACLRWRRPA